MLRVAKDGKSGFMVLEEGLANKMVDILKAANADEVKILSSDEMKFEDFDEEVKAKIKEVLRAYDKVYVTYENGKFQVSTFIGIRSSYSEDHFFCGEYKAKEIYTFEERKQNFIEVFGYGSRILK